MEGSPLLFPKKAQETAVVQSDEIGKMDDLNETFDRLTEILRAVPMAERETIAAVLAGLARTPEIPTLKAALITLLENKTAQGIRRSSATATVSK